MIFPELRDFRYYNRFFSSIRSGSFQWQRYTMTFSSETILNFLKNIITYVVTQF